MPLTPTHVCPRPQYECCTGRMPFEAHNEGALIRRIIRGAYQPVNAPVSPALVQLVDMMMTFDHRRRPDTTALLAHPVVRMRVGGRPAAELASTPCMWLLH